MKLLNFIKVHKNWEEILSSFPYCIKIKKEGEYILFEYSQAESDFSYDIVLECRGSIIKFIDKEPVYMARPFDKFFNYGEVYASQIDWPRARVTEKIDGSIIKVWYDNDDWHVSTNGMIDAHDAKIGGILDRSFYNLFEEAVLDEYNSLELFFNVLDRNYTHMFELVSPFSKVVIPYEQTKLYYLDSRHNKSGEYFKFCFRFDSPKQVNMYSLQEIVDKCNNLDWMHEGFVVFDGVSRIKVKSPAYILAHYARNNGMIGWKRLLSIILEGEEAEFLNYCPEYKDQINEIQYRIKKFEVQCLDYYLVVKDYMDLPRAQYAEKINPLNNKCKPFLFLCYDNKVECNDIINLFVSWFSHLTKQAIMRILELKDSQE